MPKSYTSQVIDKNNLKTKEILSQLPPYCTGFLNSIFDKTEPRTRTIYVSDIRTFFYFLSQTNPALQGMEIMDIPVSVLGQLTREDILEYLRWLEQYTVNGKVWTNGRQGKKRKLAALREFYAYLTLKKEYFDNNPTLKVDMPIIKEKDIEILEDIDKGAIFEVLQAEYEEAKRESENVVEGAAYKRKRVAPALRCRDIAITFFLLGTGVRLSELVGIDISDIKFDTARVNITRKGGKKDHIYMSDEVAEKVYDYILNYRDIIGANEEASDALFISSKHCRMSGRSVERIVKKYADKALGTNNGIHPHIYRKTYGTRYYDETHDIYATAAVLGHSSIETTKKHYARPRESAKLDMKNIGV